jgi:zinc transport system ATP-binding protein
LIAGRDLRVERGGRVLIHDVSLDIHAQEIVTVIGPNGAGKTTLVKALLGIYPLAAGRLEKPPGLRIGYVPQRFSIDSFVPLSVERLLRLSGKVTKARARRVLEETGIAGMGPRDISVLSGGELQRVLLARALVGNPDLLVLDEPVQGVDFAGEAKLYDLIAAIRDRRGCGVLMVSHDLHVVMAESDRVICLNGHICCQGKPQAVKADPEFTRLFGGAVGIYAHLHDHDHDVSGAVKHGNGRAGG